MALATSTALLIGGGLAAAGTAYGASKASKAGRYAADQTTQATREQTALNERIFNQTRADNEPFRQVGVSAAQALASGFGLPVTMTGGGAPAAPAYPDQPSMTQPSSFGGGKTPGGFAGTSPMEPAPQQGGPDWNAYLAANPDVLQWAQSGHGDPNIPIEQQTLEQRAAYHFRNSGQAEGRQVPVIAPQAPAAPTMTGGPAPGYNDPTAPGGYAVGSRPDPGPAPAGYVAPERATFGPAPSLDLSLGSFRTSPDFEFRVQQGNRMLDAQASRAGGRFSGSRLKAAQTFGQNLADAEYTDWRDAQTRQYAMALDQFNRDRSRGDLIYSEDRGFGYGMTRDARGDYETDRARSDGLYADDRGFAAGRYDQRNQTLLNLAGFGTGANASNTSAAQSFAQNNANLAMTGARARGDAAINSANAWNQGFGNLMTTGAYLAGSGMFGGGGGGVGWRNTGTLGLLTGGR